MAGPSPSLSRLLLEAHRAVDGEIEAGLLDRGIGGLSPGQAATLLMVERTGIRLVDLAAKAGVSKQAMMQAVDGLQALGFVRRTADPSDGRAKTVRLTARGMRARAEARRAIAAVESRARRRLGDRRLDGLRAALEEVASEEG